MYVFCYFVARLVTEDPVFVRIFVRPSSSVLDIAYDLTESKSSTRQGVWIPIFAKAGVMWRWASACETLDSKP